MTIAKRQLKKIIREEKKKVLKEMWGNNVETGSPLIEFARAYMGLGDAVASQVDAVVGAYINSGGPEDERFMETVYEQNPNAIDMAMDKIGRVLGHNDLGDEGEEVLEALEAAQAIYEQGDEEVEADRAAAEAGGDPTENRRGQDMWPR